jgi:aspartyl-tRNA(Asn)/glutamyl-tRNA(Gln) amidotransferase subunit B
MYSLSEYDAVVIVRLHGGADYFEAVVRAGAPAKAAGNWVQGEVRRKLKEIGAEDVAAVPIAPAALAELVQLTERDVVSSSTAKDVFEKMWASGRTAKAIIDAEGLTQVADTDALAALVSGVLDRHPDVVAQYRAGKANAFGFLVGQAMKASDGRANPKVVSELLRAALAR